MPGVENDLESRFRPGAMQIPGIRHRTNNVVPTLHDYARYVSNFIDDNRELNPRLVHHGEKLRAALPGYRIAHSRVHEEEKPSNVQYRRAQSQGTVF